MESDDGDGVRQQHHPHGGSLTRELGQDLPDGHAAGERVAVGAVGGDQVVGGLDGRLDAGSTSFLWGRGRSFNQGEELLQIDHRSFSEMISASDE